MRLHNRIAASRKSIELRSVRRQRRCLPPFQLIKPIGRHLVHVEFVADNPVPSACMKLTYARYDAAECTDAQRR